VESGCLSTWRERGTEQDVFIRSLHIAFYTLYYWAIKGGLNKVKRGIGVNRENLEAIRRLGDFGEGSVR